ncbi:hypothetical protein PMAYCL1PPCAC_01949, partial [Pristionchus mayeri]
ISFSVEKKEENMRRKRSKRTEAVCERNREEDLVDAQTLFHLINISDEIHHYIHVTCNAEDIFEAFEMVCNSSLDNKLVIIVVDMPVVDEFFEFVKEKDLFEVLEYVEDPELRSVSDYDRGALLNAWNDGLKAFITIWKIDWDGRFLGEYVRANFM